MNQVTTKSRILSHLILGALLMQIYFISSVQSHQPNYADCMKNPFATGCRGISAKRSQLSALSGAEEMTDPLDAMSISGLRRNLVAQRSSLGNCLRQWLDTTQGARLLMSEPTIELLEPSIGLVKSAKLRRSVAGSARGE